MYKHIFNGIKCILFMLILVVSLIFINKTLEPKFNLSNNSWPTTSTYNQFYKMKKNTIDVLFLGTSVVVNTYSPQEIYNTYGIRSYNLASDQQSIFLSYFWLKEALRFQSPKVVVLDTKFLFPEHPESPINTTEELTRKCLDPMKWSAVKREAVSDLCKLDTEQSEISYYLTNERFHSRWTELTETDFVKSESDYNELKGFGPLDYYGYESFEPYVIGNDTQSFDNTDKTMEEYMNKIVNLCKNNNISLLLLSQPGNFMRDATNNTLCAYAKKNGIEYINLAEFSHYNAIGAEFPREIIVGHSNIWGSKKISNYIGKILKEKYHVEAVTDNQYDSTKETYEHIIKNCELVHIDNINVYLEAINDSHYTIFIASWDDGTYGLTDKTLAQLSSLGLETDLKNKFQHAYAAVISPENGVSENIAPTGLVSLSGSIKNHTVFYTVTGSGQNAFAKNSIMIDGEEYSKSLRGLTFVVYDNSLMKVIDKVTFDTFGDSVATR